MQLHINFLYLRIRKRAAEQLPHCSDGSGGPAGALKPRPVDLPRKSDEKDSDYLARVFRRYFEEDRKRHEKMMKSFVDPFRNLGLSKSALGSPADASAKTQNSIYDPPKSAAKSEHLTVGDTRIEYQAPPATSDKDIIKIVTPDDDLGLDNRPDETLTAARHKLITQYACAKYRPLAIEYFTRADIVPGKIGKYCSGNDTDDLSDNAYVLLETKGTAAADDDDFTLCASTSPAPMPESGVNK